MVLASLFLFGKRRWPLVALGGAWLVLTHVWLERSVGGMVRPMWLNLQTQAKAIGFYLHTMVMPVKLNVEPQFFVGGDMASIAGASVLVSACFIAWRTATPPGRFLAGTAVLWSLPTLIMPLNVLVNERRLYMLVALACIGIGTLFKEKIA